MSLQLWTMGLPEPGSAPFQAELAQLAGWDGITFVDSQNLVGDPFVAIALAAKAVDTLRFATGVTNAFTRHPAALATVAATVQEESDGRFVLGIGRGHTALFHLGHPPMPVSTFADRARDPKVPLDVAASGPRMLELAGGMAEQVTLAVGADPDRVAWALDLARG